MASVTRVVLVGRQALFRAGLGSMLSSQPDINVLAEVTTPDEAVAASVRTHPDIVLLSVNGEMDDCWNLLAKLAEVGSEARLLLLAAGRDAPTLAGAVERGAGGIVTTEQSPEVLFKALRKVHAGEIWIDRASFASLLDQRRRHELSPEQAKIQSLTKREREIITLVGEGLKNHEVAERLLISHATVRNHLTSILDKLELSDRFELALFGLRHGLVECPVCARVHTAADVRAVKR
ncbi:MAG: LuxR C-terminal-related transcriptional regulator [Vicinamibacterales bacterium]